LVKIKNAGFAVYSAQFIVAFLKVSCWSCWRHAYTTSSVTEQYWPPDFLLPQCMTLSNAATNRRRLNAPLKIR
jgi:hypothetical protein